MTRLEDMKELERINNGLARIPEDKSNQIIKDMRWLSRKLREAWQKKD